MNSITIGRDGARILLVNNDTGKAVAFDWEGAINMGRCICYKARRVRPADPEAFGALRVRRNDEEDAILIEMLGQLLFYLPCKVAVQIGGSIIGLGHTIEAEAKAEDISFDHALLQRSGIALGLTDDPAIQKMAGNKAAWDPKLRRYVPSSANLLQVSVGTPRIKKETTDG